MKKGYHVQNNSKDIEYIQSCANKIYSESKRKKPVELTFREIDSSKYISNDEKNQFYEALARQAEIPQIRAAIDEWLNDIDLERKNLEMGNFIDNL